MQPFNPQRAPVFAKTGMACLSQPLAAAVGRDILKVGGNAADAAIAMAAMVNVTEPTDQPGPGCRRDTYLFSLTASEVFSLR